MRRLLACLLVVCVGGCQQEQTFDCAHLDVRDYTPEQLQGVKKACGTKEVPKVAPETLSQKVATGAQQMHMTPDQFMRTDYGRAVLVADYDQHYGARLLFIIIVLAVWTSSAAIVAHIMRIPARADYIKGKLFTRRRVREWHQHDKVDGAPMFAAAVAAVSALLTLILFLKLF